MGRKVILTVKNGQIAKITMPKPQAPRTLGTWFRAADDLARRQRSTIFAFRAQGCWRVFITGQSEPIKLFRIDVSQDAVEMYLLAKGAING